MRKTNKDLLKEISCLKKRVLEIQSEKDRMHVDRNLYRDYLWRKFQYFIECLAKGELPNVPWLITDITSIFAKGERFFR